MRKIFAGIFILALIGSAFAVTAPVSGQTSQYPDNYLVVQLIKTDPVPLQTSEYADVWIKVSNRGNNELENVTIRLDPQYPFSVDPDEELKINLGNMQPLEEYREHFQVKVDENAVHGENYLRIYTSHEDSGGEDLRKIPVQVRTDDAALVIEKVEFPEKVSPGTSNEMELTLRNLADSYLKNIDVHMDLSSPELPFGTSDTTSRRVQKIKPGMTKEISYNIHVDENAMNGVFKIPLSLNYENEAGTKFQKQEMSAIVIGGESSLEVNLLGKQIDEAGEKGLLAFEIVNKGQGLARFVSVKVPESNQYEVLSTDQKYLGNLQPGGYRVMNVTMYAEEGTQSLNVPLELTYDNPKAGLETETREIKVDLYDEGELEKYDIAEDPDLEVGIDRKDIQSAGKKGQLTFRIVNRGEGEASFTSLDIQDTENYEILSPKSNYLGNMDADDYQTVQVDIYSEKGVESLEIPAKLSYKDSSGELKTEVQNVSVDLYSQEDLNKYQLTSGGFNPIYAVAIIIIIGLGIIYWRRRG